MKLKAVVIFIIFCFCGTTLSMATNRFVGASKCKSCHKKEKVGAQYVIWSKGKHVKAFDTLGTPKAIALAKKIGINTAPQKEKACLICHVKSQYDENGKEHPATLYLKKYKISDGVQCEDCHGSGRKYAMLKTMKKITYKEGGAAKSVTAKNTGLLFPDENTCKQCHVAEIKMGGVVYKNPSFKDFDFSKRIQEIQHPIPRKQ